MQPEIYERTHLHTVWSISRCDQKLFKVSLKLFVVRAQRSRLMLNHQQLSRWCPTHLAPARRALENQSFVHWTPPHSATVTAVNMHGQRHVANTLALRPATWEHQSTAQEKKKMKKEYKAIKNKTTTTTATTTNSLQAMYAKRPKKQKLAHNAP